jgi:AGCS family alanine or glycine:cation symporter
MYYIENGFSGKEGPSPHRQTPCRAFRPFCAMASFGIGNVAGQLHRVALDSTFQIPPIVTGVALALFAGLVIIGGIKRIGAVAE